MLPVRFVIGAILLSPKLVSSQNYSSGITAQYRTMPNLTYLKLGAWEAKLDVVYRTDGDGPYPTVIWIPADGAIMKSRIAPRLSCDVGPLNWQRGQLGRDVKSG